MNIDSIFSQCEAEGVALSVGLGDNLDFYCSKKKISYGLKSQLKLNKPIIIEHLMGNYNPSILGSGAFLGRPLGFALFPI